MSLVTISCPSCGFSRQTQADKIPEGARQVTCPQCKSVFAFDKSTAPRAPTPAPPQAAARPQAAAKAGTTTAEAEAPPPAQAPTPLLAPTHAQTAAQPPLQPHSPAQGPTSLGARERVGAGEAVSAGGGARGAAPGRRPGSAGAPRPARPRPAPPKAMSDVGELFTESWQIFQRRFATLIGLFLLSIAAFALPGGAAVALAMGGGMALGKTGAVLIGVLGLAASIYLGFRCFAGFLHAVIDERLALKDALARGKGLVLPLIWVGFLSGFVIGGGYLLLVIPGIIFTVWFCFAQFIVLQEEVRGIDSLLKSREYVRGEWFNVALRLLLVWAASLLIGAIPMAGPILSLAFFPYVMIFNYLVYRDLREMKGEFPYPCGLGDQLKWPAAALLGYVAVPVALVSVLGLSVLGPLSQLASKEGISITPAPSGAPTGSGGEGDRVITFPSQPEGQEAPTGEPAGPHAPAAQPAPAAPPTSVLGGGEERPENLSVFIYAVNYTGTIKANGVTLQEMGGKPEMQYNYNLFGDKLRYGENLIEVDYAELPSHSDFLLKIKIKISRNNEVLKEWEFREKGRGATSFTVNIPR